MKAFILSILLIMTDGTARTQLWEEWFRQDQTALKYSTEQVIALRTYGKALKNGYALVQQGLHTIDAVKKRDFDQHKDFLDRLGTVNPYVQAYGEAADLVALQVKAAALYSQYKALVKDNKALLPSEIDYGHQVFRKLQDTNMETVKQLGHILSPQVLQSSDAERVRRVDALHAQMGEAYLFGRYFLNGYRQLSLQRQQAATERDKLKRFNQQ